MRKKGVSEKKEKVEKVIEEKKQEQKKNHSWIWVSLGLVVTLFIGIGLGFIIAFPSKVEVMMNTTPQMNEALKVIENTSKSMQWSQGKYTNIQWGSQDQNGLCPNGTVYVEDSGMSATTFCDIITYRNGTKEKVNCRSYNDLMSHYRCLNGTVQQRVRVG
jgi:hypothetical protein